MPLWLNQACQELQKRLVGKFQVEWIDLPLCKRSTTQSLNQVLEKEYQMLVANIPPKAYLVALDPQGSLFSSEEMATKVNHISQHHSHLCLVIGGPEGLHSKIKTLAQEKWSLSPLTFSHPLVRLVILESLFRTWCIMNNHPFHK